jgi:hypothetical protein
LALLLTVSCQPWSSEGTLRVTVEVDPAARAECVLLKVTGTGGEELNSDPIARPLDRTSLTVAVYQRGLPDDVTVQATGHSAGCASALEPPEGSEAVGAQFAAWPPGEVTVRLAPLGSSDRDSADGGLGDGGLDDGGLSDGGPSDGGLSDGGPGDGGWVDGGIGEDGGAGDGGPLDDGGVTDAGTLCGGSECAAGSRCNGLQQCVPQFPFEPSNFTEGMLDDVSAVAGIHLSCPAIINTVAEDGGITVESLCLGEPPFKVIAQDGGSHPSAVVLQLQSFTVADAGSLTIEGERPLIIVVRGDAHLAGRIITRAGANRECAASGIDGTNPGGGGGGGFGDFHGASAGGGENSGDAQAPSGNDWLIPLRGGCQGGVGGGGAVAGGGGFGGGALQVSAVGTITVNGVVAAPGGGGRGAPSGNHGGGGGGSGGAVLLEGGRLALTGSARLTANGGAGGEGSNSTTSGNAGGDGPTDSAWNADGGHAGSECAGNGGQGAAAEGSAQGLFGDKFMGNTCGGGGGGAAVGRIRLRSAEPCERQGGAIVSPPATCAQ